MATFTAPRPQGPASFTHTLIGYYTDQRTGTREDGTPVVEGDGDWDPAAEPMTWEAVVEFKAAVNFSVVNGLIASFGAIDGKLTANSLNLGRFLVQACTDRGAKIMTALFDDQHKAVDTKVMADLAMELVARYSDRPTTG